MRLHLLFCAAILLLLVLTGCTVTSVDGRGITLVAPSAINTTITNPGATDTNAKNTSASNVSKAVDEYYEGLFSGCIQSSVMNKGTKALSPEINKVIIRQCMVVTVNAIKNNSHKRGVPGWPGVEEIRKVLSGIESEKKLDLLSTTEL